jgi:hypothetical protein
MLAHWQEPEGRLASDPACARGDGKSGSAPAGSEGCPHSKPVWRISCGLRAAVLAQGRTRAEGYPSSGMSCTLSASASQTWKMRIWSICDDCRETRSLGSCRLELHSPTDAQRSTLSAGLLGASARKESPCELIRAHPVPRQVRRRIPGIASFSGLCARSSSPQTRPDGRAEGVSKRNRWGDRKQEGYFLFSIPGYDPPVQSGRNNKSNR